MERSRCSDFSSAPVTRSKVGGESSSTAAPNGLEMFCSWHHHRIGCFLEVLVVSGSPVELLHGSSVRQRREQNKEQHWRWGPVLHEAAVSPQQFLNEGHMAVQTGRDFGNDSGIKLWRKQFSLCRLFLNTKKKAFSRSCSRSGDKTKTKDQTKRKDRFCSNDLEIARKKCNKKQTLTYWCLWVYVQNVRILMLQKQLLLTWLCNSGSTNLALLKAKPGWLRKQNHVEAGYVKSH